MGIVVNTDDHTQPGSHWIAMYIDKSGKGTFFDSYGMPPTIYHHIRGLKRNTLFYRYNTKQLQSLNSKVCGQFCIMFLGYMKRGYSVERFSNLFSTNYLKNDAIVERFYNRIKGLKNKKNNKNKFKYYVGNGRIKHKYCVQSCKAKYHSF